MASAKITTTERNGKLAVLVMITDGDVRDKHLWNILDVSKTPTIDELLKAVSTAYEMGWQHKTQSMNNCINQGVSMEIESKKHG